MKDFGTAGIQSDPRGEPDGHVEPWPQDEMTGAIRPHIGGP
jgi:hypothetical protein